jgi:NAD(P)H-dependent FMN reductase
MGIQDTYSPVSISIIIGSVRQPRLGRVVANWLLTRTESRTDLSSDLIDLAEVELPMAGLKPGGVSDSPLSSRLHSADGFIVITPEYNHSFPAALKNAIDWHMHEWARKPVAFVSYGAGSGGVRAVEHLRLVFAELSAATTRTSVAMSAPWERLGEDGTLMSDAGLDAAADATLDDLMWWARALRAARVGDLSATGR